MPSKIPIFSNYCQICEFCLIDKLDFHIIKTLVKRLYVLITHFGSSKSSSGKKTMASNLPMDEACCIINLRAGLSRSLNPALMYTTEHVSS